MEGQWIPSDVTVLATLRAHTYDNSKSVELAGRTEARGRKCGAVGSEKLPEVPRGWRNLEREFVREFSLRNLEPLCKTGHNSKRDFLG